MDLTSLFHAHHPELYRYLVRYSGDADLAADAAQEAFVRTAERPPPQGASRAWLFKVGTNLVRELGRTRGRRLRLLEHAPERVPMGDAEPDPWTVLERKEQRERVREALQALTERDRTVLLMREEGFTHREIAEAVGTTTGSVGTLIARALEKLSTALPLDEEER